MIGVNISICERIADYKTDITKIKDSLIKRMELQRNLKSTPTNLHGMRMIREELNLSFIDPPTSGGQFHNSGRSGLNLTAPERFQRSSADKFGISDNLNIIAPQNYYCSGKVIESYEFDSDL